MRLAYAKPEVEISPDTCFTTEEQEFLEHRIKTLEGNTNVNEEIVQKTISSFAASTEPVEVWYIPIIKMFRAIRRSRNWTPD